MSRPILYHIYNTVFIYTYDNRVSSHPIHPILSTFPPHRHPKVVRPKHGKCPSERLQGFLPLHRGRRSSTLCKNPQAGQRPLKKLRCMVPLLPCHRATSGHLRHLGRNNVSRSRSRRGCCYRFLTGLGLAIVRAAPYDGLQP